MAGESPDKSEQRKSSGEATGAADPRIAVFRSGEAERATADAEKDAPATANGSSTAPEPPADRSTAVFTTRGTRAASDAPEAAEAPVTASEGTAAPEPEAESPDSEPVGPAGPEATAAEDSPTAPAEPDAEPELESTTEPKSDQRPTEVAPANPDADADAAEREHARRARDERESATGVTPPEPTPTPVPDQKTAVFKALNPKRGAGDDSASAVGAGEDASTPEAKSGPAAGGKTESASTGAEPGGSAPRAQSVSAGGAAAAEADSGDAPGSTPEAKSGPPAGGKTESAPARGSAAPGSGDAPAKSGVEPGGSAPKAQSASAGGAAAVRSGAERGGSREPGSRDAPAESGAEGEGSTPDAKSASAELGAGAGEGLAEPEARTGGAAPKAASGSVGGDDPAEADGQPGGSATESTSARAADSEAASTDDVASAKATDGEAVDRKTAVFKALKPAGLADDATPGAGERAAGRTGAAPAADESTPSTGERAAGPSGAAAAKPDTGQRAGDDGTPGAGERDAGRTGTAPAADDAALGTGERKAGSSGPSGAAPAKPGTGQGAADGATPGTGERAAGRSGAAPAADDATPGTGESAPAAEDDQAVDRKTAVFKALKRPQVDQPTAMLKLPPQAAAPAEAPAERTSKFVPLRADEVRAPAKPEGVPEAERTRQQPMPPLPPLDLLAELTNKPAPPETPTRTVVRRVKIWTPLLALVLIIFAVVQAMRPAPTPSLNLTAKSTYSFEGDKPALPWPGEGQGFMAATGLGTVGSFGEQKAVPIGSVAKAMTAYVILKDKPLKRGAKGPSIEVDAKAEEDGGLDAQGESTLNTVKEGDTLTQHDALAALMIPSANNIARLLARWDSNGSEAAFVKKMNDTAAELGMKNTKYTDPSGLNATTVSSAEDQVKLGQKLVEIPALMDITKLPEWTDPSGKSWRNYNTLVPYDGALGIKTGSTTKAGGNLLFAAHKVVGDTDQLIVGAVLGQHKAPIIDTVNAVSKDVMLATQDELESATIVKKGAVVGEVDNGLGTTVPLVATKDVKAVGWSGLTVKLELADGGNSVPLSAAAGTHVGTLTVGEGKSQVEVAVALQGDLAEASFTDKLTRVG